MILQKYNITFNHHMSIIGVTKLTLLEYNVSQMHISLDCEQLRHLLEMPASTTLKGQKRVVCMFSYYGKFINNFSEKIPANSKIMCCSMTKNLYRRGKCCIISSFLYFPVIQNRMFFILYISNSLKWSAVIVAKLVGWYKVQQY